MNSVIKEEKQKTPAYLVYDLGYTTRLRLLEQCLNYSVEKHMDGAWQRCPFCLDTPLLAQLFEAIN